MKKTTKTLSDTKALAHLSNLDPTDARYDTLLHTALTWLHQTLDNRTFRTEALAFVKEAMGDIENITYVEDYKFITLGKIAYLLNRGFRPSSRTANWVKAKVLFLVDEASRATPPEPSVAKSSEPENDPADDLLVDIVALVESGSLGDQPDRPFGMLTAAGVKGPGAKKILTGLEQRCANVPPKKRKDCATAIQQVKNYIDNLKAQAKPRAKSAKNLDKAVAKAIAGLEFQKEHAGLQVVSITPEQIIGAKALLVYNSKTRKVGLYIAEGSAGLSIKGKSLAGYDEKKSMQRTLRKPEEQLPPLRAEGSTRGIVKAMEAIPTVPIVLSGRLNPDTLLIKAIR